MSAKDRMAQGDAMSKKLYPNHKNTTPTTTESDYIIISRSFSSIRLLIVIIKAKIRDFMVLKITKIILYKNLPLTIILIPIELITLYFKVKVYKATFIISIPHMIE